MLQKRGILHAPDFVINAGGVCHGMCEVRGDDLSVAMKKTNKIPKLLNKIFNISEKTGIPSMQVAYQIAAEKLQKIKKSNVGKKNTKN